MVSTPISTYRGKVCNKGNFYILFKIKFNIYQHFKYIFFLASNYIKGENKFLTSKPSEYSQNMKNLKKNHNTCRCATKCDSMQIVNLNTASFAGQVRMGLSTIGIHLVETGYGLDVLG